MGKRGRPRHPDVLTPREWEVLALVREGLTNEQIAERLGVTLHAARYHVSEILSKLGVATREEAAAWQPEKVRAGPGWSIAFQIWLTAAAAITLIAVGVLAWGVARGSRDDTQAGAASGSPTASASAGVSGSPTPTPGFSTPPAGVANVRAMQLVNLGFAWILTDSQLTSTQFIPAGEKIAIQTKDITPPGVAIADIRGVHFLDSVHGWLVANGPASASGTQLAVYRTADGGYSWQSSLLGQTYDTYSSTTHNAAYIDFFDANMGWVALDTQQTMNTPAGDLYRTDDGGVTWTKLSIPTGYPVFLVNEQTGWVTGPTVSTSSFGVLYVTSDGGQTWTDTFAPPSNIIPPAPEAYLYDLPVKLDDGTLVLARTQSGDQDASLSLMESTDSGATWNTLAAGSVIRGVGGGFLPVVFPNGRVFAIARNGSIGLSLAAGSTELLQFSVSGLLGAVLDVQFADDKHGWALVTESRCAGFKTDCWSLNYIEQTDDGGITWGPP